MNNQILIIIILASVGAIIAREYEEITLYYQKPCEILKSVTYKEYERRHCSAYANLVHQCDLMYDIYWLPLLTNITDCTKNRITRGIGTEIIRSVGIGATNFLLSKFIPSEETLFDDSLNQKMLEQTRKHGYIWLYIETKK